MILLREPSKAQAHAEFVVPPTDVPARLDSRPGPSCRRTAAKCSLLGEGWPGSLLAKGRAGRDDGTLGRTVIHHARAKVKAARL